MEASDLLYCSLIASDAVCPGLRTISSLPSGAADGLGVLLFLLLGLIELAVSSVTSTALDAELDGTPSWRLARTRTMLGGGRRVTWPWWVNTLVLNNGAAVSARRPLLLRTGRGGAVGSGAVFVDSDDVGNDILVRSSNHTHKQRKQGGRADDPVPLASRSLEAKEDEPTTVREIELARGSLRDVIQTAMTSTPPSTQNRTTPLSMDTLVVGGIELDIHGLAEVATDEVAVMVRALISWTHLPLPLSSELILRSLVALSLSRMDA